MSKITLKRNEETTTVIFTYSKKYHPAKMVADTLSLLSIINADLAMHDSDLGSYFTKALIPDWVHDEYVRSVLAHGIAMVTNKKTTYSHATPEMEETEE